MTREKAAESMDSKRQDNAWLEWLAGGVGLLLAVALVGTIGYQAVTERSDSPPEIIFKVSSVQSAGRYYLVEVEAHNRAESTAQQVEVEGTLTRAGEDAEKAHLTFNYVPGGSEVKGGLYFTKDPRVGQLSIRPLGYSQP